MIRSPHKSGAVRFTHSLSFNFVTLLCFSFLAWGAMIDSAGAEPLTAAELKRLIGAFKADSRGPYQGIRWFCPDGTVQGPQEPCPGGHQHALPKDGVQRIARENGIYLGQILTDTPFEAFWDSVRVGSRLKQYQMEKFLQGVDDGWIMRQARYYRGALQAEDEEAWGRDFLTWVLSDTERINRQFFLLRQACADIPHGAQDNRLRAIRSLAKVLGDSVGAFMPLRIKIHGQPDARDLDSVRAFRSRVMVTDAVSAMFTDLETQMQQHYETPVADVLEKLSVGLGVDAWSKLLQDAVREQRHDAICRLGAELLLQLRETMPNRASSKRLQMMDLSLVVEGVIFKSMGYWEVATPEAMLRKTQALLKGATGCGYLELWEADMLAPFLESPTNAEPLVLFSERVAMIGRSVNWGTGTIRAIYEPTVALFSSFEPLASGFLEDRVRGSLLLGVGDVARQLSEALAKMSGRGNQIMMSRLGKEARGLNPGFARGGLVVLKETMHEMDFDGNKIYVLQQAPAEMKPVAGIATVSEGNAVSHVQLLARNLGIPNAVMTSDLVDDLMAYSGKQVFYAVSPRGVVVMKPVSEMDAEEQALFESKRILDERIAVPTERMDLTEVDLPSLMEVRATDSGVICGPKAANLGELRSLFPNRVAPGVVIPFGVFKAHMDQPMLGYDGSYWDFLQETFLQANEQRASLVSETTIEAEILSRLSQLRGAIKGMPFLPWFSERLSKRFVSVFGDSLGQVPVFVRSDTNMEDLKDFTGAGLNLTVPNAKDKQILLQAIRDVWASPFTERSYRWRQKFLLNPEQVYPSVLLLQSVPVERSGVMITSGVVGGGARDVTVAFSRGVGGAVEGQTAETYLLKEGGMDVMYSPAREAQFTVLPESGGVRKAQATFEKPVLTKMDRIALRAMAQEIRTRLSGMPEPFDVELGMLNGEVCLFQIRPFVESKRARASVYLTGLDPVVREDAVVNMTVAP